MSPERDMRIAVVSRGIARIPLLDRLLGAEVVRAAPLRRAGAVDAVAGWGCRPSARRARELATALGRPYWSLEDGFLRSFGLGDRFPPLSLVVDQSGIYYDSTRPSDLESMLDSPRDLLAGCAADVARARDLVLRHGLSKYNHAPPLRADALRPGDVKRVLLVDQTVGDMSVELGGADANTFAAMLAAARAENPDATLYVKTHPEVSAGRKAGYLSQVAEDARTVLIRDAVEPLGLVACMDRVYVVSSTLGFEALLAGKPVTCFGIPWYAGWGATDDRQPCPRRGRRRDVDELFAAAYFHYARYLDPSSHGRGTIFDVIDWLARQKDAAARNAGRMVCVGFPRWRRRNLAPMLGLDGDRLRFAGDVRAAAAAQPCSGDRLAVWGGDVPPALATLARDGGAGIVRIEDGFVRSVGLGSDFIPPWSLVLDEQGIYFDPTRPSGLERLLADAEFSAAELDRARGARQLIAAHGITKYNIEPRQAVGWPTGGRQVVLVPGQVEDDASIRLGCGEIRTNLDLLRAARQARPEAFIVYKPHPDVASGNRAGKLALARARALADHVERQCSVVSCIEACDEVHTMTSLAGFDALLRGKRVVVYGTPFYAGWGLTEDRMGDAAALSRRQRRLTLDELVAGALLRYPLYWDPLLKGFTTCEAVLRRIVETRDALASGGGLEKLRRGYLRRLWRKGLALARGWLGP